VSLRLLALVVIGAAIIACGGDDDDEPEGEEAEDAAETDTEAEHAIELAREAYAEAVEAGQDLSSGPCIAEDLMEGWVADIAHDPRQEIDNDPANQCQNFINGEAEHFVELDPEGNLIQAR
jgi:hypothetical protein